MYKLKNNIIEPDQKIIDECPDGGIGHFCFEFMKKHGEKTAQINVSTGEEETYNALLEKCIRTAIALQKMKIKKGEIVLFFSKTNLNSCVPLIASFFIGAIPLYLDGTLPLFEIIHLIKHIDPKLFLVTSDLVETIRDITREENRSVEIVTFSDEFFKPMQEETEFIPIYIDNLHETVMLCLSSGSTGHPKGICLTHLSLLSSKMLSDQFWTHNDNKVVLSFDSLHWSAEVLRLVPAIKDGICRLICENEEVDIESIWYFLEKYKVNVAFLIPWIIINMAEVEKFRKGDFTSLTAIVVVGSLLPIKYHAALKKLLPNVDILPIYGQTEVGCVTKFEKNSPLLEHYRMKPGCVGTPISGLGTQLKVVDLQTHKILGPNERGELHVKSKLIMNGYHNLDSSNHFDEDGWLKTGDLVYYDENLCFFVVGRINDLIIYQGWHIIPTLIEAELLSHPAVKVAVVIGIPNEVDTERPMALVVLHANCGRVTPTDIEKYVEEKVPDRYRLRGGVKFIKESYLETGNKIKRFKLKQLVMSGNI